MGHLIEKVAIRGASVLSHSGGLGQTHFTVSWEPGFHLIFQQLFTSFVVGLASLLPPVHRLQPVICNSERAFGSSLVIYLIRANRVISAWLQLLSGVSFISAPLPSACRNPWRLE